MKKTLSIQFGQYSNKGRKAINQDYCDIEIPKSPQIDSKGIVIALADGISSSNVSQEASKSAIQGFISDYYSTSDAWSVRRSGITVLNAINSWLYSQTKQSEFRYNLDKGYVCTFSGLILKSHSAYILHVGDSRVYRRQGKSTLELLTQDHRVNISSQESYLKNALGMDPKLALDFSRIDVIEEGDTFFLMTDGVFEFIKDKEILAFCDSHKDDLQQAAEKIAQKALENGSDDNISIQIASIDSLPEKNASAAYKKASQLPFPPKLEPRMQFDGFTIINQLYTSARSHVFKAIDNDTQEQVVIKVPSIELSDNEEHLERFLLEEWIARRITSAHVLKPCKQTRQRHYFYIVTEFIEGQTLAQWMIDNPKPSVESVRNIIEQIAQGLRAFHRLEMLHQDLRPENIMIDTTGTVKIIDFGSTSVAGIDEMKSEEEQEILGTMQFTAPEYFLGEFATDKADQFSLAVIAYQMLSGKLPYGSQVAKARSRSAQRRLHYKSIINDDTDIPRWIDFTLRKALNPDPLKRYDVLSEFIYDLRHPNKNFINQSKLPLMQRNPTVFWQSVAGIQLVIILGLLWYVNSLLP